MIFTVGSGEVVQPPWPPPHRYVYTMYICIHRFAVYMGLFEDTMEDLERKKAEIWAEAFKSVMIELIEEWGLGR